MATKKMKGTAIEIAYADEQLVCQILSRLPLKSLMRCKCVCKSWESLIGKDQWLANLHHSRQLKAGPRLFFWISKASRSSQSPYMSIMNLVFPRDESVKLESYCTANFCTDTHYKEIATATATTGIQAVQNKDLVVCEQVLKPINGMTCLIDKTECEYDEIKEDHAACLFNLITQEATPWIRSTYLAELKQLSDLSEGHVSRIFEFGFDPTNNEYKVICMWRVYGWDLPKFEGYGEYRSVVEEGVEGYEGCYRMCEILTLGKDTAWRRIHKVPPPNYFKEIYGSVYVNGYIYWMFCENLCHTLVAFDVGSEEYRVISDIDLLGLSRMSFHLIDMDGRLAIQKNAIEQNAGDHNINLWILDDDCDKNTSASNIKWTKEVIKLPRCWSYQYVRTHVIEGTEYLILELFGLQSNPDDVFLYSYNRKKKTFSKIKITGDGSSYFSLGANINRNGFGYTSPYSSLVANIDHPGEESPYSFGDNIGHPSYKFTTYFESLLTIQKSYRHLT